METTFDIAKSRVAQFQDPTIDPVMVDHRAAMNCFDCETFLQKGIDAIRWLGLAEQHVISQHKHGELAFDGFQELLTANYLAIIERSEVAKNWINACHERGYDVANVTEFYSSLESAEDWLEQHYWIERSARGHSEE